MTDKITTRWTTQAVASHTSDAVDRFLNEYVGPRGDADEEQARRNEVAQAAARWAARNGCDLVGVGDVDDLSYEVLLLTAEIDRLNAIIRAVRDSGIALRRDPQHDARCPVCDRAILRSRVYCDSHEPPELSGGQAGRL